MVIANLGISSNMKNLNLHSCKMWELFYSCIYTFAKRKNHFWKTVPLWAGPWQQIWTTTK